jgi:zinc transporter
MPLAVRQTIAKTRSRAIGYRWFMSPQRTALERLAGSDVDWLEPDDRLHLGEAADRGARMVDELEAIRERSALLHEQLTDLHAELVDTRGLVISVVALVLLPLTFLTGLLGMNVSGIPFAREPWACGGRWRFHCYCYWRRLILHPRSLVSLGEKNADGPSSQ